LSSEPLHIFDPRRNLQLQGFAGRAATTTLHDATETGASISGIFQAAEDFAVLGWWNAYDYYNHLRLKHLPETDLSGLKLEFDIEYDQALDGAMRFDSAKFPSVSWDAMTFVTGAGDIQEVRLLDHAIVLSGNETAATVLIDISGDENMDGGIDWLHLYFRDTRFTVTSTDCRVETQLTAAVTAGDLSLPVQSTAGFSAADGIWIERAGTNEEQTTVAGVLSNSLTATVSMGHPSGSFVTRKTKAWHVAQKLADLINTTGASVAGRFGPDQSSVIHAQAWASGPTTGGITITFVLASGTTSRYGKLGNLDRVFLAYGRTLGGVPVGSGQGFQWSAGSGASLLFTDGDNNTKYHVTLDFTQPMLDKLGVVVPMSDCRKMYMVFAPRFENVEQDLQDGCFLTAGVGTSDATWTVDDTAKLTGGRYFIGTPTSEERIQLLSLVSATQINVTRGFEASTPGAWSAGARLKKVSPVSGFSGDVEWGCAISNIMVTGNGSLKVGGESDRIEEADPRCKYTGFWEDYKYAGGFPSQWWSSGHAKRCAPANVLDVRKVVLRYSYSQTHDLYLGSFLNADCGKVSVSVDGVATTHDLYLNEYGGTTANLKVRGSVAAGNHTVEITALFDKNAASTGYYFYFDYLWPLEPQDVPDAPQTYTDVSLAMDFDTDHGFKKPPAWHLWQLQKLGFNGHADVYMGVFWNNKRRRINATYPYATVVFSGTPVAGDVVSCSIGGTTIYHAIGYGETLQGVVADMRAIINGLFAGVWADDNFGSSTTLRIQSKAPAWTFTGVAVSAPNSVTLTLTNNLGAAGVDGDWEMIDAVSPVMTEGARKWIRDLASQFQAAGIKASFAFSMECYLPPTAMRAKYLSYSGGVVSPGADVDLGVPSHQMHFGARVRAYLRQMYKECADQIDAAGLQVVLQFGETQWWYFDNQQQDANGGMPYYDPETISDFAAAKGHQIWPFRANTEDPAGDPTHANETADFLRDRIWAYCQDVITYVRSYHPTAVFECLWPLDANQGSPKPSAKFRALNFYVNLPRQWKNSSYGIKYFRCEGFDYDVWQKNSNLMKRAITFAVTALGRPASECMFLSGLYGPPDPPMAQAYGLWLPLKLYSFGYWAFDQFCLNSRPVPLEIAGQMQVTGATYYKPLAARAIESVIAVPVGAVAGGALNRFEANTRKCNG
jgi:hypothetical protein